MIAPLMAPMPTELGVTINAAFLSQNSAAKERETSPCRGTKAVLRGSIAVLARGAVLNRDPPGLALVGSEGSDVYEGGNLWMVSGFIELTAPRRNGQRELYVLPALQ